MHSKGNDGGRRDSNAHGGNGADIAAKVGAGGQTRNWPGVVPATQIGVDVSTPRRYCTVGEVHNARGLIGDEQSESECSDHRPRGRP